MSEFWKKATSAENVGGPLTEDQFFKAIEDMKRALDAYHREPPFVIVPPNLKQ
jgi:hypothetical protein